jgi:hypothetical protein
VRCVKIIKKHVMMLVHCTFFNRKLEATASLSIDFFPGTLCGNIRQFKEYRVSHITHISLIN